jgi:hypothetical protein
MLLSKYSSGRTQDSPTDLSAAKWITASKGRPSKRCAANNRDSASASRTSTRCASIGRPASRAMRSSTAGLLLLKLSATTGSWPRSASTTQVWLPM